jgi:uncharacterized membrane protein
MKRFLYVFLSICAGFALFLPVSFSQGGALSDQPREEFATAKVIALPDEDVTMDFGVSITTQHVRLQIISGKEAGKVLDIDNGVLEDRDDMRLALGEVVVLDKTYKSDGSVLYLVKEKYRLPSIVWLTIIFVAITVFFGRLTGLTSILGLAASVLILVLFVIPRIVAGDDPLIICLVGAVAIACSSLFLAHGFNKRTSVALLSTVVTLGIAAIAALISVYAAGLFGMGSEESMFLQSGLLQNIDLRGLLLGGMIIGCLGVLDDITTAQCAAIEEISKANPMLSVEQLRKAGFSVGREHIASLINTLALAYVGASLPLLLLFKTQDTYPLWVTLNGEFLAEEIIRTLVGSVTLVFAVPVSIFFAVSFLKVKPGTPGTSANSLSSSRHSHSHGHH